MKEHFHATIQALFHIQDTRGIELFGALTRAAHLSEFMECQVPDEMGLSSPRFRLMLALLLAEQLGHTEGLTPTEISKRQRVSKNTISALLRGLEEQGLVERGLDPHDLRVFRIHLTPAGRELVFKTAPKRIEGLNRMLEGFSAEEVETLTGLLEKLVVALHDKIKSADCEEN